MNDTCEGKQKTVAIVRKHVESYLKRVLLSIYFYSLIHEFYADSVEAVIIEVVRDEPTHQARLPHASITKYHDLQQGVPIWSPFIRAVVFLHHHVK